MRSIGVFCGSSTGKRPGYVAAAKAMGRELAARGLTLVYGGGNVGLMGQLADAALEAGGQVVGVIPRIMVGRELAHRGLTRLELVGSMHERKSRMVELADGFVALPGGFGTFDELFEVMTWTQLGIHDKPIGVLDVDGYFDAFAALCARAIDEHFVRAQFADFVVRETSAASLLDRLATHKPPAVTKWADLEDA